MLLSMCEEIKPDCNAFKNIVMFADFGIVSVFTDTIFTGGRCWNVIMTLA